MDNKEWQQIIDSTFQRIQQISATKGKEYTRDSADLLDNFYRYAASLQVLPVVPWYMHFNKHIDSITVYIRDLVHGRTREMSEPIEGRIDDAIVYLLLFKGLLRQMRAPVERERNIARDVALGEAERYAAHLPDSEGGEI